MIRSNKPSGGIRTRSKTEYKKARRKKEGRKPRVPWGNVLLYQFSELEVGDRFVIPPQPGDVPTRQSVSFMRLYRKISPVRLRGVKKPCNARLEFFNLESAVQGETMVLKIS